MRKIISILLLAALLAGSIPASLLAGAATESSSDTPDEKLFSSSFEADDRSPLLSVPDGDFTENLVLVKKELQQDGLTVDLSTVYGSEDYVANECKTNLFDGSTDSKFLTENTTAKVGFALETGATVTSFMIASANDEPSRDPKSITLYGSNDNSSWVRITSAELQFTGDNDGRKLKKTVDCSSNTQAFLWYRLDVTANNGSGNMTQFSELTLYGESLTEADKEELVVGSSPLSTLVTGGPDQTWGSYTSVGWTGKRSLTAYSQKSNKEAKGRNIIYDNLSIDVSDTAKLSYVIFPAFENNEYDHYYTSMHFVVDLKFSDGSYLSSLNAFDHNGMEYTPEGQAHGEALFTMQWNYVEVDLAKYAQGKTVEQILIYFDMNDGAKNTKFTAYFDDIVIENRAERVYENLSDYIDIRRGTNNTAAFSRGLTAPGVAMPNGFNFYTPITDTSSNQVPYKYQLAGSRNTLDSMSVMHVPSNWIASWGTWQFMPNTSVSAEGVKAEDITSKNRQAEFMHEKEIARAHYYSVTFEEGSAASGVTMEVTPTSHGMYARFTFPENSENVNLIFDCLWGGSSSVAINADGSFTATSNHTNNGSSKMYIYGVFDTPVSASKTFGDGSALVSFAKGTTEVTMKLATSYLSSAQAKHSMELEIGGDGFDEVFAKAQKAWDDICSVIEIEGATYTEKVTFYSNMYRLYAYPNLYSENEGTSEAPKWVYASPYNGGRKAEGKMYVTNGFWDTYRTAWAAYGLFTPELDGELLDGLVQHYIDQGWVPRWIAPGGVNSMVGTSSDVIFADACIKGLDFDLENAYNSMLKNASVVSKDLVNGGREETATSVFKGYISNKTGSGYSWTMEGFINDFGLYVMSEKLGKTDEAEYYRNRCLKYVDMFNKNADFFMGKNESGGWSSGDNFNPASWWGDYTEASGWIMAFTTVYDGNGLANLYGGQDALADKLDEFFNDSVDAMRKVATGSIHEMVEAREVRMGQYAHNNQPSHHIIYMYSFTNEPYKAQALARTAMKKLYVGSEIGQGYCGDEDNGEMSAWYIFSAMGFYPLSMGSGEYVIGSPLFDKVTIHLENGEDVVITANNNTDENVYIRSCKVNGKTSNSLVITHEQLLEGADITFEMGKEPSSWGTEEYAKQSSTELIRPSSLTEGSEIALPLYDVVTARTKHEKTLTSLTDKGIIYSGIKDTGKLFDDTSDTYVTFNSGESLTFASSYPRKISMITLTSSAGSRKINGFTLEASNNGSDWVTLDKRSDLTFEWSQYTRPFSVPEEKRDMYYFYRLTFEGSSSSVSIAEIELLGVQGDTKIQPGAVSNQQGGENKPTDKPAVPAPKNDAVLFIVIGAVVLAGIVCIIAFFVIKKKTKKPSGN